MAVVTSAPPMISGNMPLIGHAAKFLRDPVTLLRRGYAEKGRVFGLKLGNRKAAVILGPENNKFLFQETDKLLSIREAYPFFIKMFSKDFYFFAPHEEYLRQRAIVLPRFHGKQMRGYVSLMAEETKDVMDSMGDSGDFDLIPTLGPLVMNIAAHSFLGRDFRRRLDTQFFDDFRDFSGGMETVLPLWLPLPRLLRSAKAKKKIQVILQDWIEKRRENPIDPPDFFQEIIEAKSPDGRPLDDLTRIHLILLMVWAGHETTAGHVSWALIDLLQNPDYLEKVRDETIEVLGNDTGENMDWQDARDLEKMELAIKETERLHPVAYVIARKAKEDIVVDGFRIAKDTMVFAAPCVTHRMPDVFPDPDRYNPDRFTTGTGEVGPELNKLIGFGGGLHRCSGVNFARLEMKIILSMLLKKYDLALIDKPRPIKGASTYWPAQPCRVRYTLRREESVSDELLAVRRAEREKAAVGVDEGSCPFHKN